MEPQPPRQDDQKNDKSRDRARWWTNERVALLSVLFNGILALCAIVGIAFFLVQYHFMAESNRITRESNAASDRTTQRTQELMAESNRITRESLAESKRQSEAALLASREQSGHALKVSQQQLAASNRLTSAGLNEARKQYKIAERSLELAESPAFTVVDTSVTIDGLLLKMRITVKNSGKGVAKIRQVRWVMASEAGSWSLKGADSAPDSTLLGEGDIRNFYQTANWPNAEALKAAALAGIRFYAIIDYSDFAGRKMTTAVCQHYDSADGARDCLTRAPINPRSRATAARLPGRSPTRTAGPWKARSRSASASSSWNQMVFFTPLSVIPAFSSSAFSPLSRGRMAGV